MESGAADDYYYGSYGSPTDYTSIDGASSSVSEIQLRDEEGTLSSRDAGYRGARSARMRSSRTAAVASSVSSSSSASASSSVSSGSQTTTSSSTSSTASSTVSWRPSSKDPVHLGVSGAPFVPATLTRVRNRVIDRRLTGIAVAFSCFDIALLVVMLVIVPPEGLDTKGIPDATAISIATRVVVRIAAAVLLLVINGIATLYLKQAVKSRCAQSHISAFLIKLGSAYFVPILVNTDTPGSATGYTLAATAFLLSAAIIAVIIVLAAMTTSKLVASHARRDAVRRERAILARGIERNKIDKSLLTDLAVRRTAVLTIKKTIRAKYFRRVSAVIVLVVIITFVVSLVQVLTDQRGFFREDEFEFMDANRKTSPIAADERIHSTARVVSILVDGLRYDHVDELAYWKRDEYKATCADDGGTCADPADFLVLQAETNIPSMSVPNWLASWSGAPPEITGQIGNLLVDETNFDTLFNRSRAAGLDTFAQGNIGVIQSWLTPFGGDGSVKDLEIERTKSTNVDSFPTVGDAARRDIALTALGSREPQFDYLFLHMQDVDEQGHCCGVTTGFNADDTYRRAVRGSSESLRAMIDKIHESDAELGTDTFVFIFSDHGHVDAGGHGGVGKDLVDIPFILYRRGYGLATVHQDRPELRSVRTPSIDDHSATVAALLGVRVPTQSFGTYVTEVFYTMIPSAQDRARLLQDLVLQKQNLCSAVGSATGTHLCDEEDLANVSCAGGDISTEEAATTTAEQCTLTLNELVDEFTEAHRPNTMNERDVERYVGGGFIAALVIVLVTFVLTITTVADPVSIVYPPFGSSSSVGVRKNRIAAAAGFGTVAATLALSIGIYLAVYAGLGYDNWDSTAIHEPSQIPVWLVSAMVGPLVVMFVLMRIFVLRHMKPPSNLWGWRRVVRYLKMFLYDRAGLYTDPAIVHLFYLYILLALVFAAVISLFAASENTFFVPGTSLSESLFITTRKWQDRFRLITVAAFLTSMLIVSYAHLVFFGISTICSSCFYTLFDLGHWRELSIVKRGIDDEYEDGPDDFESDGSDGSASSTIAFDADGAFVI